VPGAAAGLADVGTADPHPPVLLGRLDQVAQELAVGGLDLSALGEDEARLGDPVGKLVADGLQLAEVEDPRLAGEGAHRGVDPDSAEGLSEEPGQDALETADLTAQLAASQTLVGSRMKKAVSLEQFPHRPSSRV
jgi:hypothetical protein